MMQDTHLLERSHFGVLAFVRINETKQIDHSSRGLSVGSANTTSSCNDCQQFSESVPKTIAIGNNRIELRKNSQKFRAVHKFEWKFAVDSFMGTLRHT